MALGLLLVPLPLQVPLEGQNNRQARPSDWRLSRLPCSLDTHLEPLHLKRLLQEEKMADKKTASDGDQIYEEREAVAIFHDESSLNKAIDELMQTGIRREDLSLLADSQSVPGNNVKSLEDKNFVEHTNYVSPDSRTEGLAALVAVPVYVACAGVAAVATGGASLIPTVALVAGTGVAAGALGLMLARIFGREHAERVQEQIAKGGLLLWVHLPDKKRDGKVTEILKRNGAQDVHLHVVKRSWGVSDVPLHDTQPDPLLR
jgi:hypothetical protein